MGQTEASHLLATSLKTLTNFLRHLRMGRTEVSHLLLFTSLKP